MAAHPSTNIKEKKETPQRKTEKAKNVGNREMRRHKVLIAIGVVEKRQRCQQQSQHPTPPSSQTFKKHIEDEQLEKHESKPIATFIGTQLMEEHGWWSQQEQKDKRRNQLHHCLMTGNNCKRALRHWLKQPATQHKEAGQAKKNEHRIEAQLGVSQTKMTDMCIDNENHRESSHRINIPNSLLRHLWCKSTSFFVKTQSFNSL